MYWQITQPLINCANLCGTLKRLKVTLSSSNFALPALTRRKTKASKLFAKPKAILYFSGQGVLSGIHKSLMNRNSLLMASNSSCGIKI